MDRKELKRILERTQMSQTELAREVGVTSQAVCRWLSGKRKMHPVFGKVIREVIRKKEVA